MICPAACQVEPLVSSAFSRSTTSAPQPSWAEVIGEAAAHDAAADDHDTGVAWDSLWPCHGCSISDFLSTG